MGSMTFLCISKWPPFYANFPRAEILSYTTTPRLQAKLSVWFLCGCTTYHSVICLGEPGEHVCIASTGPAREAWRVSSLLISASFWEGKNSHGCNAGVWASVGMCWAVGLRCPEILSPLLKVYWCIIRWARGVCPCGFATCLTIGPEAPGTETKWVYWDNGSGRKSEASGLLDSIGCSDGYLRALCSKPTAVQPPVRSEVSVPGSLCIFKSVPLPFQLSSFVSFLV